MAVEKMSVNVPELTKIKRVVDTATRLSSEYYYQPPKRLKVAIQIVLQELMSGCARMSPEQLVKRRKSIREAQIRDAKWERDQKARAAKLAAKKATKKAA